MAVTNLNSGFGKRPSFRSFSVPDSDSDSDLDLSQRYKL
ncbi:hypothetical protein LEP1GSC060_1883 [Leptospira weilii serovar Ranarum str. ICFT]|uniref:Uncharacterized protein n=1 Tax=Leptospira weilii serovar Ranarum str. ICFT TaxID=1218598 RepID=N1WCN0_9LEPT|nr:hypothetical protein LEP1GSC060_1883 [Leptospira weilii serovar Ranarum str. ICFT]